MPPASRNRRARASLACAVVALLGVPVAAQAAVARDPDARPGLSFSARDTGPDRDAGRGLPFERTVDRLGGADRYATAVATSRATFPADDPAGLTTVYLTSMTHFDEMNHAYRSSMGDHAPARTAVAVVALPVAEALVEIEAWARTAPTTTVSDA